MAEQEGNMPVLIHLKGSDVIFKESGDLEWLRLLKRGGAIVHAISTLHELPAVLEGGSA